MSKWNLTKGQRQIVDRLLSGDKLVCYSEGSFSDKPDSYIFGDRTKADGRQMNGLFDRGITVVSNRTMRVLLTPAARRHL